jgi:hypothetical protein
MMTTEHYLRSMPTAAVASFGIYLRRVLAGGAVFTIGPRNVHRLVAGSRTTDVAVLARLWLADELPPNSESRVLSVMTRELRREGRWKALVSYADPAAGHDGTIYRSAGWFYLGQGPPEPYVWLADGQLHHPRSVYSRYLSNNVGHLSRTGVPAVRVPVVGKHRYVCVLDRAWTWRLAVAPRPYPRAPPAEASP